MTQNINLALFLFVCSVIGGVSCINLPGQVTSKPRRYTSTAAPAAANKNVAVATRAPPGVNLYEVKEEGSRVPCILLQTDSVVEIKFNSIIGEETGDSYIPKEPLVDGNCKDEDESEMTLIWEGYRLVIKFAKTPGGERWYVDFVQLSINTDNPIYHNLKQRGHTVKLNTEKMILPTPVGKSYKCDEVAINLTPAETSARYNDNLRGTLYLRDLQVQPFMYKGKSFGAPFECNVAKTFRDETAPIAVGSTLAIAVLATVTGYGAFRYYKIKKVQYNTME